MSAWKWNHTREDEDNCEGWLPLVDENDHAVASYAGCGSHEIKMTPEHAAVIEAAYEMYEFLCELESHEVIGMEGQGILDSIEARQEEFSK